VPFLAPSADAVPLGYEPPEGISNLTEAGHEEKQVAPARATPDTDPQTVLSSSSYYASRHASLVKLDAHLDTSIHFTRPGWQFDARHEFSRDLSQVDLPRMRGNLDGGFFVVFVAQGPLTAAAYDAARLLAFKHSDTIDSTIEHYSEHIGLALCAEDVRRLKGEGRAVAFKSIENSYPLGEDIGLLAEFKRRGVRLAGPVHARGNQFADSSTDVRRWEGLSPLGRNWVAEMNRLGLLIDASHASDAAFDQMVDLSAAPIILSHSSPRVAFDHPRNLDDDRIRRLARSGGVFCFSTIFLSAMDSAGERMKILAAIDPDDDRECTPHADLVAGWQALDAKAPIWAASLDDYMSALLHVINVAGIDHVGFGADWDGAGGLIGFEDVSRLPVVTGRLIEAGFSRSSSEKLWGANLLRALSAAQGIGASS
jgi:membrane dipeptidase